MNDTNDVLFQKISIEQRWAKVTLTHYLNTYNYFAIRFKIF